MAILDLLRFMAAIFVLLYHYHYYLVKVAGDNSFALFKFGYLGVNFFFMLSGFVIMASAHNRSAIKFGLLRALRLYPAFISCLIITLVVLYLFGNELPSVSAILLNALIINDYFGVPNVDGVYWTLQAELKFYGCVFLLILFSFLSHYRVWLSIWIALAISFHYFSQPFFLGWLISPTYSFFFIGGVSAYYIFNNAKDRFAWFIFMLTMAFSLVKSWEQITGFCWDAREIDRMVAAAITFCFYLLFIFLPQLNKKIKPSKLIAVLGGMSYPLYLIHSRAGLELVGGIEGVVGIYGALLIAIFAVLATSLLVHLYIEKPIFKRANAYLR
ncbi:acyltransferase [Cellvibrio sp. pealriver]|uniref:acyltransferase family protein n=1 Tax=Cellvibrio sp. pealriver TaxID=1622269 RepID=UPI0018CCAF84|nr:acyltransferase [Cellvibrio sp. pealriver]